MYELASEKKERWRNTHYPVPKNVEVSKGARENVENLLASIFKGI
jgi:hypothetical protein